jgi:hypothetical protein
MILDSNHDAMYCKARTWSDARNHRLSLEHEGAFEKLTPAQAQWVSRLPILVLPLEHDPLTDFPVEVASHLPEVFLALVEDRVFLVDRQGYAYCRYVMYLRLPEVFGFAHMYVQWLPQVSGVIQ